MSLHSWRSLVNSGSHTRYGLLGGKSPGLYAACVGRCMKIVSIMYNHYYQKTFEMSTDTRSCLTRSF